jgi:hypothetical protein
MHSLLVPVQIELYSFPRLSGEFELRVQILVVNLCHRSLVYFHAFHLLMQLVKTLVGHRLQDDFLVVGIEQGETNVLQVRLAVLTQRALQLLQGHDILLVILTLTTV